MALGNVTLALVLLAAPAAPEPPAAVPPAQLVRAAEDAYAEMERIGDLAGSEVNAEELTAPLAKMERDLVQLRSASSVAVTMASDAEADYLGRELQRQQEIVRRWDDALSARVQLLDAAATSLRRIIETWRLTAAALGTDVPAALAARAQDVRDRAAAMEAVVRKRMGAAFELQDRIAALKLALSAQLGALESADAARRQELFEIESMPLWRAIVRPAPPGLPRPLKVLAMQTGAVLRYAASEPTRSALHLTLTVLLVAAGLVVTRRLLSAPAQGRSAPVTVVARYPVDSAILMALFATPIFHPERPPALALLVSLIGLIPVLRIASVLAPGWRRPVRWGAALFVTERLVASAPQAGLSARIALLLVTLAAALGCAGGFRSGGWLWRIGPGRWRIGIAAATAVASVLFAVSAVANVVGNVNLAGLLATATLASAFSAAALVVLVVVVMGSLRAVLELPTCRRFAVVRDHGDALLRRAETLLRAAAVIVWAVYTLRALEAEQSFREAGTALLAARVTVGSLNLAVGDVVAFVVTLWIAIWLARALRFVLDEAVLPSLAVARGSAAAISATATYVVVALGFGAAVLASGVEMTRFAVLAGTLGVGIGFGLQNVVNNFVSGLVLLYERPIQVGDVIEVGNLSGEVRRIGVRSSTVRTFQGADVIVPNSNFISAEVINWTGSDRFRRVDIGLGVAYGTEAARVADLLVEVAKRCPGVAAKPEPVVFFTGFGDSALQFELRIWASVDDWGATASRLRAAINDAVPRAGIVLAFPQLDLWVRSVPPGAARTQIVPGGVTKLPAATSEQPELPLRKT